jgi:hypothetical protein
MKQALEDLDRRRPIWSALSDLFLDTELTNGVLTWIGKQVIASGYSPAEVQSILWNEVFPVLEANLRSPAGVWEGYELDWLEKQILHYLKEAKVTAPPPNTVVIIKNKWRALGDFLPNEFKCAASVP